MSSARLSHQGIRPSSEVVDWLQRADGSFTTCAAKNAWSILVVWTILPRGARSLQDHSTIRKGAFDSSHRKYGKKH
jgi:hypothetical protein